MTACMSRRGCFISIVLIFFSCTIYNWYWFQSLAQGKGKVSDGAGRLQRRHCSNSNYFICPKRMKSKIRPNKDLNFRRKHWENVAFPFYQQAKYLRWPNSFSYLFFITPFQMMISASFVTWPIRILKIHSDFPILSFFLFFFFIDIDWYQIINLWLF